ncbi:unnamed protein product [Rotaria sordida]|uniref:Uncharacterized protein n=2 Tax=Rotaria sordida TaxID=392033 RepID=A0A819J6B1_9BILA|nr:unnamed protein product [Rotaria sordida]CAF4000513.1 unnamed protein product [Rotaria sordida]
MSSEIEVEILKAQGINNVLSLLRAQDLYSFFKLDCEELEDLRNRACLKLKNGEYMIRPAIKDNLDYCIAVLKGKLHEQLPYRSENHDSSSNNSNEQPNCFINTFISSLNDNMNRSKYRYQYNSMMRRFASSVYALGGRNVYQFLRLNIPGAFPSIPTLESYHNEFSKRIEEGEYRFDELVSYSNKINCSYIYISEDCTSVISKVNYDVTTNSFIGFCPELKNGLPSIRQYQTDDFYELEEWFQTVKQSTLVNIHTVQPITHEAAAPFLLSCFGTDNQIVSISILFRWLYIYEKCHTNNIKVVGFSSDADPKFVKAMRLATGYFSQLPNINILDREDIFEIQIPDSWICTNSNAIKFPTHHKQNQNNSFSSTSTSIDEITMANIEQTIYDAYEHAKSFIEKLEMLPLLVKNHVFELNSLCIHIRDYLKNTIYINDYSILNDDDLEFDSDSDEEINNDLSTTHENSESECEDSDNEPETKSTKDNYNGMRIYSSVADKDKRKFFKMEINGKQKYIHKQTAAWYLTNKNNRLSSDRTVRVQQTNKQ